MFSDRARAADAGFALSGENRRDVARLVTRLDGMPLAIELAAARVEALGVTQLLDRLDGQLALLAGGDRLAAGRHRSLAAAAQWSYQLLAEHERRVFRQVSVFPAAFTLEAAEAVAGRGAAPAVLRLVECSLLVPPRSGPDGRMRYAMLETLRGYAAGLLAGAGEQDQAQAALAGYAAEVAEQAAAGLQTTTGEPAAARRLDAEDATTAQVLGWAIGHDAAVALRLAAALGWWWSLRARLTSHYGLLCQVADHAAVGSDGWCAAQFWLGQAALSSADLAAALSHFTQLRDAAADRGPCQALANGLAGRSETLSQMGRHAEAAEEARLALAVAREHGYPAGEALALGDLTFAAFRAGDYDGAVRLARQAGHMTAGIPGSIARSCSLALTGVLIAAGDLAAAEPVCAAALAQSRSAGDLWNQAGLVVMMATLDLQAGRLQDAAAHLREALQIDTRAGAWLGLYGELDFCGHLCAATRRCAEAVTVWAAFAALKQHEMIPDTPLDARRRDKPLRQARQVLGPDRTRAAEERGAAMTMATAAEYALMLTDPGPPQPTAPGAGKLSARERQLVALVAQGHTNAQIAAQLYISVRTVTSHLDRIRDKTGCRRRADLTRLALTAGLL